MEHLLACRCGEVVVKSVNGTTKIRNKVLVFRGGKGFAICKGCGVEVPVPLTMTTVDHEERPRLFVSKPWRSPK